ncbi:SCO family protein [Pseudomonadota bacterium]
MNSEAKNSPMKALIGITIIVVLFASVFLLKAPPKKTVPAELQAVLWPEPRQLQAFELNEAAGGALNLARFADKWTLLFFGYTSCPDVCPMTLSVMKAVYDSLAEYPEIQAKTQVLFVSVDPERDSPEHIAKYVAYFDKSFTGATGSVEAVDKFAAQLSAGYVKEKPAEDGTYQVSHTGSIYLIGPKQRVHGAFSPPHKPKDITELYLDVLKLQE